MALLITRQQSEQLLDPDGAMQALEPAMIEEVQGTTFYMPPYGGSKSSHRTFRSVGGGLLGMRRMGIRVGGIAQLFDTESGKLVAIVAGASEDRVGATMGLAARYLARPDASSVGLLGSGRNALQILQYFKVVRPVERVNIYSPTPAHRNALAERATAVLGIPVTVWDSEKGAITDVDIIAVGTSSYEPVVSYADLRPGVHVTSMGMSTELDESVYLGVDQFVVSSRQQELETASPAVHPYVQGYLDRLVRESRYDPSSIVELGSIIKGDVAPRNGPTDINLFRESRGGVGDVAMANWVYKRAREQGVGLEVDL